MDRECFNSIMGGGGKLDYEIYLNTKALLACQKDFPELGEIRSRMTDRWGERYGTVRGSISTGH